jgi:hypothetical protein
MTDIIMVFVVSVATAGVAAITISYLTQHLDNSDD